MTIKLVIVPSRNDKGQKIWCITQQYLLDSNARFLAFLVGFRVDKFFRIMTTKFNAYQEMFYMKYNAPLFFPTYEDAQAALDYIESIRLVKCIS